MAKKLGFKVNGLFITGNESKHWSQLKRFVDNNPRLGMASMKLVDGEIIVRIIRRFKYGVFVYM